VPDLLLTKAPHWDWLAVLYFFVGGIAGGSYVLATIAELFGRGRHRGAANAGFLLAFPAIVLGGIVLILDLKRPDRFWHMLFMSERFPTPMFKWWSPMSVGAWLLLVFGAVSFVTFLMTVSRDGRPRFAALSRLRESAAGRALVAIGGLLGMCVTGYTGVLLAVTNRPVWSETPWIGALFTISAMSTSAAVLTLWLRRRARDPLRADRDWLGRTATWVFALETIVFGVLVLSLGPALSAWANGPAIALAAGVVVVGMLLPMLLRRRRGPPERFETWAAVWVLVGGFCLRALLVVPVERL
jgi:protein NrfD